MKDGQMRKLEVPEDEGQINETRNNNKVLFVAKLIAVFLIYKWNIISECDRVMHNRATHNYICHYIIVSEQMQLNAINRYIFFACIM